MRFSLAPRGAKHKSALAQLLTWLEKSSKSLSEEEEADAPGLEALDDDDLLDDPERPFVRGPSGKIYHSTAFFCLKPNQQPRKAAIFTIESKFFDPIILLTIIANCTTMAWESPLDPHPTWKSDFIDVCEWVYLYIFTFELLAKMFSYGLIMHEHSYLRDAWCQLDFVVVTLAWIPILFPSFGNYSVIRSIRALRPLRALKRVPGMPVLVASILAALPPMGNVVGLCAFIFLVFGIVGTELFMGTLHCGIPYPTYGDDPSAATTTASRRLHGADLPFLGGQGEQSFLGLDDGLHGEGLGAGGEHLGQSLYGDFGWLARRYPSQEGLLMGNVSLLGRPPYWEGRPIGTVSSQAMLCWCGGGDDGGGVVS